MRVKLISGFDLGKFDKEVNDFLETIHVHKIIDIKLSTLLIEGMATKYAMVIYD